MIGGSRQQRFMSVLKRMYMGVRTVFRKVVQQEIQTASNSELALDAGFALARDFATQSDCN
jgi:hypothetical protein